MILAAIVALQTPPVSPGEPAIVTQFKVADRAVSESSGLAASRRATGVFYTHNDSGDSARFFRFNKSGQVTATFELEGVKAIDWEDMEAAVVDGVPYLYLADTGDNRRVRNSVTVHRVVEPEVSTKSSRISKVESFTFTYPKEKKDCEAVFVNPQDGSIWFVTKAWDQKSSVYVVRSPRAGRTQELTLVVDDLRINTGLLGGNLVTGASASTAGDKIVVKTYSGGYEYRPNGRFESWVKQNPTPVQFPMEKQGEGVCYSKDGSMILSSTEGNPCWIRIFAAPDDVLVNPFGTLMGIFRGGPRSGFKCGHDYPAK